MYLTDPFTILELHNVSYDVTELHKIRRSPNRESQILRKGRSGMATKSQNLSLEI